MAIIGLSVVKNEADIIEAMVRHNLRHLDHLHVIDNGSSDATYDILQSLQHEGLCLSVDLRATIGHMQSQFLAELANATYPNENLVFLDADEVLAPGSTPISDLFNSKETAFRLPWVTYVPTPDDSDECDPIRRISHRRKREVPTFYKATLPAWVPRPINVSAGSHKVRGLKTEPHPTIRLAHFPLRSSEQLASKALLGSWNVRLRGAERNEAFHWHALAKEIREIGLPDAVTLQEHATNYAAKRPVPLVFDPLPLSDEKLRYTSSQNNSLLINLITFAEDLVAQRDADRRVS